jgi:hypothetical protein
MNGIITIGNRIPKSLNEKEAFRVSQDVLLQANEDLRMRVTGLQRVVCALVNKFGEERPEGGKMVSLHMINDLELPRETELVTLGDKIYYNIIVTGADGNGRASSGGDTGNQQEGEKGVDCFRESTSSN